jgi:hypothetical protein
MWRRRIRGGIAVAHDIQSADAELRGYLHAELADFVETYVNIALASGDTELATYTQRSHQMRLDARLEGREVRFINRSDLPDWHPESPKHGGDPDDRFSLGPDDVLRPEETKAPKLRPPNRAQRRAMGWRGETNGGPVR